MGIGGRGEANGPGVGCDSVDDDICVGGDDDIRLGEGDGIGVGGAGGNIDLVGGGDHKITNTHSHIGGDILGPGGVGNDISVGGGDDIGVGGGDVLKQYARERQVNI